MSPQPKAKKYHVPSVDNACHILCAVCESSHALSMPEIAQLAMTSRTTTLRIVSSLCDSGFLARDEAGRYKPGATLSRIGSRLQSAPHLRERALPILKELAESTGETTHLAIPLETHCLLQEVVDSPQLVRVASRPGTLVDYHCSVTGKSILAYREDLLLNLRKTLKFTKRTPNTLTTWKAFDQALTEVREQGYAVDDEEYHEGVRCVGAPVRDESGQVIAAIGVTGTSTRLTKRQLPVMAKRVIQAANQLSAPN